MADGIVTIPIISAVGAGGAEGCIQLPVPEPVDGVDLLFIVDSEGCIELPINVLIGETGSYGIIELPVLDIVATTSYAVVTTITVSLPKLNISGQTTVRVVGNLTLPAIDISATLSASLTSTGIITLPSPDISGIASVTGICDVIIPIPHLEISSTTLFLYTASGVIKLPCITIKSVLEFLNIDGIISLPLLLLNGQCDSEESIIDPLTADAFKVFRLNIGNSALSTLTYGKIKGYVNVGDVEYIATNDGLYKIDDSNRFGDMEIDWLIQLPLMDFGVLGNKRLRAVKLGGEFRNRVIVGVGADEGVMKESVTLPMRQNLQSSIQSYVTKSVQGRYLNIVVKGHNKMAIDNISVIPILVGKRVR